ncbi:hypothetical protein BDW59DRAFT_165007 [Aspergillus cavernicola]|uniref:Uncharacterized protein n=1 Tax=Aspergillus cavernicola TaxID=176166 RepID=A0ABR4HWU9_9EURO
MSLEAAVLKQWHYRTVTVSDRNARLPVVSLLAIWGDAYHMYSSIDISYAWNNVHTWWLVLHELIISTVTGLENHLGHHHVVSSQLIEDIIASIPFHLGAGNPTVSPSAHFIGDRVPAASGMMVLGPLVTAASSRFASRELREWIVAVVQNIGHFMGLNQALAMAMLLQEGLRNTALSGATVVDLPEVDS